MAPIAAAVGFYGKLPCRGDFLRRRVPQEFLDIWDEWLQSSLAHSRHALQEAWLDAYLTSPVWRFALAEGVCGTGAYAGVIVPSVDRVGRYFPLTIVAQWNAGESPLDAACGAYRWFNEAEALAMEAPDTTDLDAFDAAVMQLAERIDTSGVSEAASLQQVLKHAEFPHRPGQWHVPLATVSSIQRAVNAIAARELERTMRPLSVWWTDGSDRMPAAWLTSRGLPAPESFAAMLSGEYVKSGWNSVTREAKGARAKTGATSIGGAPAGARTSSSPLGGVFGATSPSSGSFAGATGAPSDSFGGRPLANGTSSGSYAGATGMPSGSFAGSASTTGTPSDSFAGRPVADGTSSGSFTGAPGVTGTPSGSSAGRSVASGASSNSSAGTAGGTGTPSGSFAGSAGATGTPTDSFAGAPGVTGTPTDSFAGRPVANGTSNGSYAGAHGAPSGSFAGAPGAIGSSTGTSSGAPGDTHNFGNLDAGLHTSAPSQAPPSVAQILNSSPASVQDEFSVEFDASPVEPFTSAASRADDQALAAHDANADFELGYFDGPQLEIAAHHEPISRKWNAPPQSVFFVSRPDVGLWAVSTSGFEDARHAAAQAVADLLQGIPAAGTLSSLAEEVRRSLHALRRQLARQGAAAIDPYELARVAVFLARDNECALIWFGDVQAVRCRSLSAQFIIGVADFSGDATLPRIRELSPNTSANSLLDIVTGADEPALTVRYESLQPGDSWLLAAAPLFDRPQLSLLDEAMTKSEQDTVSSLSAIRIACAPEYAKRDGPLPVLLLAASHSTVEA